MSLLTIRRILVPVDLSDVSFEAWKKADELAIRLGATLETVYILSDQETYLTGAFQQKSLPELKQWIRSKIRGRIGSNSPIHVLRGNPVAIILRLARERPFDLIVMGTHGRKGLRRLVLGSVTETVIRQSRVPVLAVRGRSRPIQSILNPVAFTHYAMTGFAVAAKLAATLGVDLTLLHVIDDPTKESDPRALLENLIGRLVPSVRKLSAPKMQMMKGRAAEKIVQVAALHDLVVMVFHRKSAIADWREGTTLQQVLRHCPVPVLAVPYLKAGSIRRRKMLREVLTAG